MSNIKKETFPVRGMACTGCEPLVEAALFKIKGVLAAKASFAQNEVTVTYDAEKTGLKKMRAALEQAGYTIAEPNRAGAGKREGEKAFTPLQFAGIALILIALYLIIKNTVGFNFIPDITSSMGYGILFIVGLLTSLHCVAMCGGVNMSQCVGDADAEGGIKAKIKPSLLYNLGRVISYTVIGGIIGAIGSVVSFSGWAKGVVAVVAGVFMMIMGLSFTGLFPWINKITPRLPKSLRRKAGTAAKGKGPLIVGLLNGLMPCGPLQAMQLYALGTGSFIAGALSMFSFSLGTLPLMFGLGALITMMGSKFTKKMMAISAVLVVVLGVVMLGRGLALSGVSLPWQRAASASESAQTETVKSGDVQNITSTLPASGYPDITVEKGVPVVWNLKADQSNLNGCNKTLVISEYDVKIKLQAGDNIIQFTPTETGTFTYSCWMGMQTGQITVVDDLDGAAAETTSAQSTTAATASEQPSCCTQAQTSQ